MSLLLRSAKIQFRDWSVSRNHFARPGSDHIKSKINTRYSKHRVLRYLLYCLCFVWDDLSRSFCVHLHDLHKRIQTFEGCILNVWKCIYIMKQFKCGLIFPYLLSKGTGDKGAWQKELFKPEMQNYGVLSQCTIIHLPWSVSMNLWKLIHLFFVFCCFLFLLSLHKWVDRW